MVAAWKGHVGAGLAWRRIGKSLSGRLKPSHYQFVPNNIIIQKKLITAVFIRESGDSPSKQTVGISYVLRANTSRQTDSRLNCCLNTLYTIRSPI